MEIAMTIRTIALAGALAAATALSAGAASAAPTIPLAKQGTPAVELAYNNGHRWHKPRICYVPFRVLVHKYGFRRARVIQYRCNHYRGGHMHF
jgi:hypothetical protein